MNIALIIGGGSGTRTGQAVPKQFLTINDKPLIVHTMTNIDRCDCIDGILVVCPPGWENFVVSYKTQYKINKFIGIVSGGNTRYESIECGIEYLKSVCSKDDRIVIIDANRPLISHETIREVIKTAKIGVCALPMEACYDSMFFSSDGRHVEKALDRQVMFKAQSTETIVFSDLLHIYDLSKKDGKHDIVTTLCLTYGLQVIGVPGSSKYFKITTQDDFKILKALLDANDTDGK